MTFYFVLVRTLLLLNRNPIAQSFKTTRCDLLVRGDTRLHFDEVTLFLSGLDQALFGMTVLDNEDSIDTRFTNDGASRYEHSGLRPFLQDLHSCKLSGLQCATAVVDLSFDI